jgi:hypothetical protein
MAEDFPTLFISVEAKRRIQSITHALHGWVAAKELLQEIERKKLVPSHGLFEGLMVGACVLYGRPFKKAGGLVRLDDFASFTELPNAKYWSEVHQATIDARDMVLAHQDVKRWAALPRGPKGVTPPDELRLTFAPDGIRIDNVGLLPQANLHELLLHLINIQIERAERLRIDSITSSFPPGSVSMSTYRIEATVG